MRRIYKAAKIFFVFLMLLISVSCTSSEAPVIEKDTSAAEEIQEEQSYYNLEDVVLYLKTYNKLPPNYITKKQARELGWNSDEGNLWEVSEGAVIGGDVFRNREGLLEEKPNRVYYEADINYKGGYRGPERIVYSNDGVYFYTKDHYKTFQEVE